MDFTTYKTGVSWNERDGEQRGISEQLNWKKALAKMETPSGELMTILQLPNQAWEGHTVNGGAATTDYVDFMNQLLDAIG